MNSNLTLTSACLACLVFTPWLSGQQPDRNAPCAQTLRTLGRILENPDESLTDEQAALFEAAGREESLKHLTEIREAIRGFGNAEIDLAGPLSGQFKYEVAGRTVIVNFRLTDTDPCLVKSLVFDSEASRPAGRPAPLTWESLEQRLDEFARQSEFDGAVMIVHDGNIAVQKAWGFANREKQIPNRVDTVFAIGSAPIDFTHAGILLLSDRGQLNLDDPISKFLNEVPTDKQTMTIRHLMSGGSGLPDFHDVPTDENPDHSWIDRDEAVRRILGQKLLFEPGAGNEHSHSAWGLLAAIIEIVSGQSYQDFSREHLYQPAGLTDTGFFGDPVPEERIAVGYGLRQSSDPNSPPHWGPTSWLVMGSGGQVSTLADIYRWEIAVRSGKILSPESTRLYVGDGNGVSADGDMFGFDFMHSHDPDNMFLIITNSMSSRQHRQQFVDLARQIHRLVKGQGPPPKFLLGVNMAIVDETVTVRGLVDGGAAERGGLRQGDVLIAANGTPLADNPMSVLEPLLQDGRPIDFQVQRGSEKLTVSVKPDPQK